MLKQLIGWFITADPAYITDELVAYYRQNPDEIEKIENEGRVHRLVLPIGFTAGLILVFFSKIIGFYDWFGEALFFNEVVVDLLFELGVAIWGGVVTTAFLEVIENREKKAYERYRRALLLRIKIAEQADAG